MHKSVYGDAPGPVLLDVVHEEGQVIWVKECFSFRLDHGDLFLMIRRVMADLC